MEKRKLNVKFYHLCLRSLLSHIPSEAGRIWWKISCHITWSYIATALAYSQR